MKFFVRVKLEILSPQIVHPLGTTLPSHGLTQAVVMCLLFQSFGDVTENCAASALMAVPRNLGPPGCEKMMGDVGAAVVGTMSA